MPKVVSSEQRIANRRNARKSTGPRTAKGKARSARNALKHGLLAKDVVIDTPGATENRADFDALLADLLAELQPQGIIEETLVERIATCYWRLRRAQRLEADAIRGALDLPDPQAAELESTRRGLKETENALALQTRRAELLEIPAENLPPEQAEELRHSLTDFARADSLDVLGFQGKTLENTARKLLPGIVKNLQSKSRQLREKIESAEHEQARRQQRESLSSSLPRGDAFIRVVRYETMLDRQIHRALAELRRIRSVPRRDTRRKAKLRNEPI